jgi:hypothetical protein
MAFSLVWCRKHYHDNDVRMIQMNSPKKWLKETFEPFTCAVSLNCWMSHLMSQPTRRLLILPENSDGNEPHQPRFRLSPKGL